MLIVCLFSKFLKTNINPHLVLKKRIKSYAEVKVGSLLSDPHVVGQTLTVLFRFVTSSQGPYWGWNLCSSGSGFRIWSFPWQFCEAGLVIFAVYTRPPSAGPHRNRLGQRPVLLRAVRVVASLRHWGWCVCGAGLWAVPPLDGQQRFLILSWFCAGQHSCS